jgi:hypothetical protein
MATQSDEVAEIMRLQRPRDLVIRLNEYIVNQARVRVYATNESPRRFIQNRIASKSS